jgi:hypothetical protein
MLLIRGLVSCLVRLLLLVAAATAAVFVLVPVMLSQFVSMGMNRGSPLANDIDDMRVAKAFT